MAGGLGAYLSDLLTALAESLGCTSSDLRLDHQPALAIRDKVFRGGHHVDYDPPCDSADDLIYRTHIAHLVKTNHSGDHGQHPDRVLIKRERRRAKKLKNNPGKKRFGHQPKSPTRSKGKSAVRPKYRWPKRKFENRGKP